MSRSKSVVLAVLLGAAVALVGVWSLDMSVNAYSVQRVFTIEELDEGFLVRCSQASNPYPYRQAAQETFDRAVVHVTECFKHKTWAWPDDRKQKRK